jgi:hypothetical protein
MINLSSYSQTVISGYVKNKQNEAISSVTVTVQRLGASSISGFTSTDKSGKFKLIYNGAGDSLLVTVRGMMIEKMTRTIPNRSATVDFVTNDKATLLKEVVVKASPVIRRKDTLSYVVGAFTEKNDRTIEDVLKKMPGINVSSSGEISYNGKAINKFYIEDVDMLGGRYNIATHNINADDVASVQVYENHQPIKADFSFSDQTAINLRLKNSAKGIWTVQALAGAGYEPVLWDAELTAMHFAHNRQHISTYKGNNCGHTADEELLQHYDKGALPTNGGMLSVSQPYVPDVEKKRYIDNTTNSVSINQLVKIKDTELTTNINYYNERLNNDGYTSFTQYLPNAATPLVVEEVTNNTSRENQLDVALGVQKNEEMEYLKNKIDIQSAWSKTSTHLVSPDNKNYQHLDRPYFSIENELDLLKRIDRHLFRFYFDVSYNSQPHQLDISPAFYFRSDSLLTLSQEVVNKRVCANLRTSYELRLGNFTLNYTPRVSIDLRKMTSSLDATNNEHVFIPAADSMRNELWYNSYQIGVNQDYTYQNGNKVRIRLTIPTYLSIITNNDCLTSHTVNYQRGIVNPSLVANYNFTPSLKVFANGNYRKSHGNMDDAYKGYILQSYRNLLRNTTDRLYEHKGWGGNCGLEYRDVIRMLFANVVGGYRHSRENLIYGCNYDGIVGIKTTMDQPTNTDTYSLDAGVSKTLSFWHTKIETSAGMNRSKSELLRQNVLQPFHIKDYSLNVGFNTSPLKFVSLTYKYSWEKSKQWVNHQDEGLQNTIQSHNGTIWLFPMENLSFNINVDYLHFSEASNPNMAFADALIRYRVKRIDWELECNNLFNANKYVSKVNSGMSTYINSCNLRSRCFILKARFKIL